MQNLAAQAYGRTAVRTASPREVEAQLLLKAAAKLEAARTGVPSGAGNLQTTRDAITYNRKLWTVFASSITRPENPLPNEIKENIGNLAIFILGQSIEVFSDPDPDKLASLVSINREIAAGLSGNGG